MNDMTHEVELMFPQGKELTVNGETLKIKPFTFGQFPKVLALLKGVNNETLVRQEDGTMKAVKLDTLDLVMANSDKVVDLCVIATGKPRAFFDTMSVTDGIDLCQALIEVNADFFVKRLQPKMTESVERLSSLVGAASSLSSSKTATDSPT